MPAKSPRTNTNAEKVSAPTGKAAGQQPGNPADFTAALRKNKRALAAFDSFSPSHRREYLKWIAEATRDETRNKRIATTITWLERGKPSR